MFPDDKVGSDRENPEQATDGAAGHRVHSLLRSRRRLAVGLRSGSGFFYFSGGRSPRLTGFFLVGMGFLPGSGGGRFRLRI